MIAWYIENSCDWFVGYVKVELSDNQYSADHLEKLKEGNSTAWKYSDIEDSIFNGQIIPVKVVWDWNVKQNTQHMKSELKNIKNIALKGIQYFCKHPHKKVNQCLTDINRCLTDISQF